jgi:hypothetical protein
MKKAKNNTNGYLDLKLQNILNAGEEFKLNWKERMGKSTNI